MTSNTPMSPKEKLYLRVGIVTGYLAGAVQVLLFWWMS